MEVANRLILGLSTGARRTLELVPIYEFRAACDELGICYDLEIAYRPGYPFEMSFCYTDGESVLYHKVCLNERFLDFQGQNPKLLMLGLFEMKLIPPLAPVLSKVFDYLVARPFARSEIPYIIDGREFIPGDSDNDNTN